MLEIQGLSKTYRGGVVGLEGLTLSAGEGVLGLLGRNGAGQTTLMSLLATVTRPTAGSFRFQGVDGGIRCSSAVGSAICPRTSACTSG